MARRIPSLNWLRVFEAAARAGPSPGRPRGLTCRPLRWASRFGRSRITWVARSSSGGPQSVMLTEAGRAYLPAGAQTLHGIESTTADLFGEPVTLAPGGDLFADARVGLARASLAGT